MRYIELALDKSIGGDMKTVQLRMTEAEYNKVEQKAEEIGEDPDELLTEIIHTSSVSGNIRSGGRQ